MSITVAIPPGETGAAKFLAWVAYPGADDATKRKRWAAAAQVIPFKMARTQPPAKLRGMKNDHLPGVYSRGVNRLQRRRRPAVWLMMKRLQPEALGGLGPMAAYSKLLDLLPAEYGYDFEDPFFGNLKRLCWRESLPALAMAVPVVWLTSRKPWPGRTWHDLLYRLDTAWVDWAIGIANAVAPAIEQEFQPLRFLVPKWLDGTAPQLIPPVSLPLQ